MGNNPSKFLGCDNCPVEQVSWNDIQNFINKINQKTGGNFRLPTEAEWEYAAKGGILSKGFKFSGDNHIDNVAWYESNSKSNTHPVGLKKPNELGIYDMIGNIWELCSDWHDFGYYSKSPATDPKGPNSGAGREVRGGAWCFKPKSCLPESRSPFGPSDRSSMVGFRLASGK